MSYSQTGAGTPQSGPSRFRSTSVHVIIKGHDLRHVADPNLLDYYRCIGQFELFEPGNTFVGTGTVIQAGDNVGILTCAHNLCLDGSSNLIDSAEFTPCQGPDGSPFDPIAVPQSRMWISPGYKSNPVVGGRYDYAVVKLKRSELPQGLGPLPQMSSITPDDSIPVQVTGYPAAVFTDNSMGYSIGSFVPSQVTDGLIYYTASTAKGSSGSGVCIQDNLQFITAVHVDGSTEKQKNWGVYLTKEIIQEITEALAS